jgi:hypothetical protein
MTFFWVVTMISIPALLCCFGFRDEIFEEQRDVNLSRWIGFFLVASLRLGRRREVRLGGCSEFFGGQGWQAGQTGFYAWWFRVTRAKSFISTEC